MFRRYLPKLILCATVVVWAVFALVPVQDRDFATYLRESASAKQSDFARLLARADERIAAAKAAGRPISTYTALKQIGEQDQIDLGQEYFPHVNLGPVKNIERRNAMLLNELLKRSKGRLQLGLDLKGGVAVTLQANSAELAKMGDYERSSTLAQAIKVMSERVNSLGVAEPVIRASGDDRIEIQMPGASTKENPDLLNVIRKPAVLEFRLVMQGTGPMASRPPGEPPPGYEFMAMESENHRTGQIETTYFVVKTVAEMTGENISDARPMENEFGQYTIHLGFNAEGRKQFGDVTSANVNRLLAIVLDGKLYSAPNIDEPILGGNASIRGSFTPQEATELAQVLNNPLAVRLDVQEQYEVGPSLAEDAVASAKLAFVIGTALTVLFILAFYTLGGVVAAVGMAINVLIILALMASFGATLTLPGIAGIVLTLAMSVDANILIFERMKEELRLGKTLPVALEAGFDKAWSAIIDGNLTTLITAAIMAWLGTGPVKGFGVTLTIGIFTTMFAAVVVSKLVLELLVLPGVVKRLPMFSILQTTRVDFLKHGKAALIAAGVLVAVGLGAVAVRGGSVYGIDFTGGDTVTLTYAKKVDLGQIRSAAAAAGFKEVTPVYQQPVGSDHEVLKITTDFDQGEPLVAKLQQAFPDAQLRSEGVARIGPSVGHEIQWNALTSLLLALAGMLVYVAFRFEFGYGVGALAAVVVALLVTVGVFVLAGRQFNASMVAAILLVVGYGINDTIVVFDRIREELKLNPTGTLRDIVNRSLNLTLSRTIITGGTTILTAVTLMVVTSGEVNDIAFTLLAGVFTTTFCSLYVATPVFYWWHKGDRKHVEAHHDIAPKYEWAGSSRASE
ncbi:MAG TPA: protein translocase subunit SecD [Opitutaceae bacterium]|nr:protein translocase subunit SecD [Opitutaceae bacterium]